MKLLFDNDNRHLRNRTELRDSDGRLMFWGIYDFAFKYRTRIFDAHDIEIAYVEKDVTVLEDTVVFYDPARGKIAQLQRDDGKLVLKSEGICYEGDADEGEVKGMLKIGKGVLETENDQDLLKAVCLLFALIEIDR